MKIDLHVHTKQTIKDEPKELNIPSIDFFINTLEDNDVGVVAITNHNELDLNQYLNIIKAIKNDEKILVLPGVELNLLDNENCERHINIIKSNETNLENFVEEISKYVNSKKRVQDLNLFTDNYLIYVDTKRNNKSWKDDKKLIWLQEELGKCNINKKILCDVNNKFSLLRYRARNFNTLVGSDLKNWHKYSEYAKELIDVNISFKSFENFLKTFCYQDDKTYNNLFKELKFDEFQKLKIEIENNEKVNIGNLKIYDGINIIFGPKASGKTKIIKEINNIKKNKSSLYCSDDKKEIIDNFFKNEIEKFKKEEKANKLKNDIISLLEEIKKFDLFTFNEWNKLFSSLDKENELKIYTYFKYENVSEPENKKINEAIINSKKLIENLENKEFEKIQRPYLENLKELYNKLVNFKIHKNKQFWKQKMYKEILNKIEEYTILSSGKEIPIQSIGLFKRWENLKRFSNNINSLKSKNFPLEKRINKNEIQLLDRGLVDLCLSYKTLNFSNLDIDIHDSKNQSNWMKGNKGKLEALKKFLESKSIENIKINFTDDVKNLIDKLIEEPFYIEHYIKDKNNKSLKLSNGEEAILSLTIFFEDNEKEYYILDEPDTYLSAESLFDFLIEKIWEKSKLNKKIIIATHNPALAINSIPFNMIYRDKSSDVDFFTYEGNVWTNQFININNDNDKKEFVPLLLKQFEHEFKHFEFRKEVYEK